MAEIISIEGAKVKIGADDGKVITAPIAAVEYADPKIGDKVKVYKDGERFYVLKDEGKTGLDTSAMLSVDDNGSKSVNKHIFVWVCCFLFGGFGVDRFIRGQVGTGVCKLFFGWLTLGIWPLVDWIIAVTKAYGASYGNVENITFDASGAYTK